MKTVSPEIRFLPSRLKILLNWALKVNRKLVGITMKEFKETGIYTVARKEGDNFEFIAHKAFRDDPEANPLKTPSGKLEIHCQDIADFVKNSGFDQIRPIPAYLSAH